MVEFTVYNLLTASSVCALLYALANFLNSKRKQSVLKKWEQRSQNKVILHGMYHEGKKLPTPSPFVLKLETYLRMAKISYEIDKSDIWSPKGKTPWLSINGQHVSDSQLIIEFLGKKFEKQLDANYSNQQIAIGNAVRIMMEEYVYWGGVLWRFSFGGRDRLSDVMKGKITFGQWAIFKMIASTLKSMAWSQGLGRHSEEEVLKMMKDCLKSLSHILGNKSFILGASPCEVDCCVFSQLASAVYMDNSPFQQLINGELRNLQDYCDRMMEEYFPELNNTLLE